MQTGSIRRIETYFWIALALAVVAFAWFMKRPDLSPALAPELLSKGALLVDVRSPSEFSSGHIEGARNIPVNALAGRSGELGGKDRPVILYCASGTRIAMAKRALRSAGFSSVYNLGAMSNWS